MTITEILNRRAAWEAETGRRATRVLIGRDDSKQLIESMSELWAKASDAPPTLEYSKPVNHGEGLVFTEDSTLVPGELRFS